MGRYVGRKMKEGKKEDERRKEGRKIKEGRCEGRKEGGPKTGRSPSPPTSRTWSLLRKGGGAP